VPWRCVVTARPTYRRFARYDVYRRGLLNWEWQVTDGIGGKLLLSGHRWTRTGAALDAALAAAICVEAFEVRLERICDRLAADGLHVEVSVDEQDRVCVRPLCACSTRDEVRVLAAFLALTSDVLWVGVAA
jgi:hypothetical protein